MLLASTGVSVSFAGMGGSCSMNVDDVTLMSYAVYGVFGCLGSLKPVVRRFEGAPRGRCSCRRPADNELAAEVEETQFQILELQLIRHR